MSDYDDYKSRGGEKADKLKNKKYMGKRREFRVNGVTAENCIIKSRGNNTHIKHTIMNELNDPDCRDDFQMPIMRRVKSYNRRNICKCCLHFFQSQKFYWSISSTKNTHHKCDSKKYNKNRFYVSLLMSMPTPFSTPTPAAPKPAPKRYDPLIESFMS